MITPRGSRCGRPLNGLLQGSIDRGELGFKIGAKPVHDRDNGERDSSRDQPVLNGRCAGFINQKSLDRFHLVTMVLESKDKLNPTA
jgi:hypothetical protein